MCDIKKDKYLVDRKLDYTCIDKNAIVNYMK